MMNTKIAKMDPISKAIWNVLDNPNDKSLVLKAVSLDGYILADASDALKADKDVVLKAVGKDGLALQYASPELQSDKDVVLAAVDQDAFAFEFVSPELKRDENVVRKAIEKFRQALQDELQDTSLKLMVKSSCRCALAQNR